MPRFLYVQGVPGRPVAHPYADAPGVFVGLRRWREDGVEQHREEASPVVIQDCPHLRDAVLRGELVQIALPVVAGDANEARAKFEAQFSAAKASRKGSQQ